MKNFEEQRFTGERALFRLKDASVKNCIFDDGESPLKESLNIEIEGSQFEWKYPLWYSRDIEVDNCILHTMARAGIWYTANIAVKNTTIQAPKQFRRCKDVIMENVHFSDAQETLWNCSDVTMVNVNISNADYFGMNCKSVYIENMSLDGNYAFDGAKDVTIKNSKLLTKDAFWNAENITIYDSYITGEYFGWNSKNVKLVNCTIESLQGFCYMDKVELENCKLINTTLAFEYSTDISADINSKIDSITNPISGVIVSKGIDLINQDEYDKRSENDKLLIAYK